MTALSDIRDTRQYSALVDPAQFELPVAASTKIYQGGIVCDNGSGYMTPGATATTLIAAGVAQETVDNSTGSAGDKKVPLKRGVFHFANLGADEIAIADRYSLCYVVDDQTVAKTNGGSTRSVAGVVMDVDATGVWVMIGVAQALSYASLSATVAAHAAHLVNDGAFLGVPLSQLRETTAFDVGNIAANGGLLASDTTPVLSAINDATDGCQRVLWAAGNVDQVMFQLPLPPDLDDTADIKLYTRIASEATNDAQGFAVKSFFNEADTAVDDTSATNATTAFADALTTIAAADVPSGAKTLTVGLTPVTHDTDDLYLTGVWIEYTRKLLT